ncbi:MAG: hypothetical protein DRK00_08560 [Thermoprotei archaeon]|nr:MAG: hypothetical protein DRK00_08560 [Thermoprotei archaeon]
MKPDELVKACIGRHAFHLGRCRIVVPSMIAGVELRRTMTRMIIIKGVTSEDRLAIPSNI